MKILKIFLFVFLIVNSVYAQEYADTLNIKSSIDTLVSNSDKYSELGLVGIERETKVSFGSIGVEKYNFWISIDDRNFYTEFSYRYRIRIQSKKALENYTNFKYIPVSESKNFSISIKLIKSTGVEIGIDSFEVKKVKEYSKELNQYYSYNVLVIPNTDLQDELEISIKEKEWGPCFTRSFFLNGGISYKKSIVSLIIPAGLTYNMYCHNGLPSPEVASTKINTKYTWTDFDLDPVPVESYSILNKEFPYVRINLASLEAKRNGISKIEMANNWGVLYDSLLDNAFSIDLKARNFSSYMNENYSKYGPLNSFDRVSYFVNKINREFEITKNASEKDFYLTFEKMLIRKSIDEFSLLNIYPLIFHHLKIPFETILAKNKYNGAVYENEVFISSFNDVFYSFADENGTIHYIYPAKSFARPNIDEIPYQYEDTRVIILNKQNPFKKTDSNYIVSSISEMDPELNKCFIRSHYKVVDDSVVTFVAKSNYAGEVSFDIRRGWQEQIKKYNKQSLSFWLGNLDSVNFKIDTIFETEALTTPPFNFKYELQGTLKDAISEVATEIKEVKLKLTPSHNLFYYSPEQRTTTAYLPYLFSSDLEVFIEFPKPASILNIADFNKKNENEVGSFYVSLAQVSPSIYKLNSTFKLIEKTVTSDKYPLFLKLCESAQSTKQVDITYKYTK